MKSLFTAITFAFLFIGTSIGQDVSVDDIIDTYFENIGGKEGWRNVKSMRITGEGIQMGMKFPLTVLAKEPNLQIVNVEVQGMSIVEAYDGEVAWATNPFGGSTEPTKKSDEETAEAAKESFQDDLLDYKEKGHTVSLEGTEEYEGSETYKLKLVRADGEERIYFFDTELMIPLAVRSTPKSGQMKGQTIDAVSGDFQEVDGLMVPFSLKQKIGGQTAMEMISSKVEFNVPISDEEFSFPGN